MALQTGMKNRVEKTVPKEQLASSVGSGALDVFGTPFMVLLMEEACFYCVRDEVGEGSSTVGTHLDISHDSPTPMGCRVYCDCELTEIDGRKLVFSVEAYDEFGLIGKGTHERYIVDNERFLKKVSDKKNG